LSEQMVANRLIKVKWHTDKDHLEETITLKLQINYVLQEN